MNTELALSLWKSSQSEGLPSSDCTSTTLERLLHLELSRGEDPDACEPALRLLAHCVVGASGYSDRRPGKRRVPSAGARYPVECLLLTWREAAPRAWLVSLAGSVLRLSAGFAAQVARATRATPGESSVVVVASLWKTIERYGLAGVRYTVYDAGHVLSNLAEFAIDEGERLGLGLRVDVHSVFRELSNHVVALYAVRLNVDRPALLDAVRGWQWPVPTVPASAVNIDPPSFSPLLARARALIATMARDVGDRPLPLCSLTREPRRGFDWIEARRSVKGFSARPAAQVRSMQLQLRPFLRLLLEHAQATYGLVLGVALLERTSDNDYLLGDAVGLSATLDPSARLSAQALLDACNGQAQVVHAEALAILFVQLAHLPPAARLAVAAAAQNCIGILSAEIYRWCALERVGTTMLCGFSQQRVAELLDRGADWPLALHLFGDEDAAGVKSDTRYFLQ